MLKTTNIIRQKLEAGEPTLSTHIHSVWPSVIEAIGHTGLYDYFEFVAEYGPFDLHDLDNMCRAGELHGLGSMIKIDQSHQSFLAQRGVGAGFDSVLYTDCRSVEDVKECIRQAKPDTPNDKGMYGVATRRNSYMGYGGSKEYVESLNNVVVALMIEKNGAVEDLEAVLSVPGVDMVQWGAADFSMSIGRAGERGHADVIAAHDKVFKMAVDMGVNPRVEINTADDAKRYLDMGVRHFSVGTDITILYNFWKTEGEGVRKALEGA